MMRDQLTYFAKAHHIDFIDDLGRQSHSEETIHDLYKKGYRGVDLIHEYDRLTGKFLTRGALKTWEYKQQEMEEQEKKRQKSSAVPEVMPTSPEIKSISKPPDPVEIAVTFVSKSAPKKVEPVPEIPVQPTAQIVAATRNIPSLDTQNIQTIPAAALAAPIPKVDEAPIEKEPIEKVLEPVKPGIYNIDIAYEDLGRRNPPKEIRQVRCVKYGGEIQYYLPPVSTKKEYQTYLIAQMIQEMPFHQVLLAYYKKTGQPLGPAALGEIIQNYGLRMVATTPIQGFFGRLFHAGVNVITAPFWIFEKLMELLESRDEVGEVIEKDDQ